MNDFVSDSITKVISEVKLRTIVAEIVAEIVTDIEVWELEMKWTEAINAYNIVSFANICFQCFCFHSILLQLFLKNENRRKS